jgi:hypothetical protein
MERKLPTSFFHGLKIYGAERPSKWGKTGLSFIPYKSDITITYSTITCMDFYRIRGRIESPNCDAYPALSFVEYSFN